jgi:ATP-binding cassette subfamily F protein uup
VKVSRQGSKILELDKVSKKYGAKEIIENFSYTFKKGDRIGLAGKNGTGKSTFLNLITGEEKPDTGVIAVGETTVYGYYKQGGLEVNENDRVLDVVKNVADYIEMANGEVITASQLLTHFLFPPEKQFGFVNKLSGGERKRLQLMRVLMKNPNFLILDEPSNDLDIDTLNVLEDFLDHYKGVLILVSHDRYLLDKLTEQLFIFEGRGRVQIYNGNYADFKLEQDEIQKLEKEKQKKSIQEQVKPTVKEEKKKLSYKEQLEYTKLEEEIEKLEQNIKSKTEELNQVIDHLKLSSLAEEIQSMQKEIDQKSERWLYLADFM